MMRVVMRMRYSTYSNACRAAEVMGVRMVGVLVVMTLMRQTTLMSITAKGVLAVADSGLD